MLELKLLYGMDRMYSSLVRLGLRSINARDKRALKRLDKNIAQGKNMRNLALKLRKQADMLEDGAHLDYSIAAKEIRSAYGELNNALGNENLTGDINGTR